MPNFFVMLFQVLIAVLLVQFLYFGKKKYKNILLGLGVVLDALMYLAFFEKPIGTPIFLLVSYVVSSFAGICFGIFVHRYLYLYRENIKMTFIFSSIICPSIFGAALGMVMLSDIPMTEQQWRMLTQQGSEEAQRDIDSGQIKLFAFCTIFCHVIGAKDDADEDNIDQISKNIPFLYTSASCTNRAPKYENDYAQSYNQVIFKHLRNNLKIASQI